MLIIKVKIKNGAVKDIPVSSLSINSQFDDRDVSMD